MGAILLDKEKCIVNQTTKDPVFLLMSRTGVGHDKGLSIISPFLIKRSIDTIGGTVRLCKKLKTGQLLIQCNNGLQANKIIKMKSLSQEIFVNVEEHTTLNKCKGMIYTQEIRTLTDSEILFELKEQNPSIMEVKRIKKRDNVTKALTNEDVGLYIVTFNTGEIPEKIYIG